MLIPVMFEPTAAMSVHVSFTAVRSTRWLIPDFVTVKTISSVARKFDQLV